MDDFLDRFRNWKTTFAGFAGVALTILVLMGKITDEESGEIIPIVDSIYEGIASFMSMIISIILIFSKDKGVTASDLGERLSSWTSTIVGFAGVLATVLVLVGVLGTEESGEIVPNIEKAWGGVLAAVTGILSIIAILKKDS